MRTVNDRRYHQKRTGKHFGKMIRSAFLALLFGTAAIVALFNLDLPVFIAGVVVTLIFAGKTIEHRDAFHHHNAQAETADPHDRPAR